MKNFAKKILVSILMNEARLIVQKYEPKVIMVTGSVGKTTTKDAVYQALKGSFYVRKSEKSENSEIGIPLTIIGAKNEWGNPIGWLKIIIKGLLQYIFSINYPNILVLEVGADRPGDLDYVCNYIEPFATVVTRFPDVPPHLEFYESIEDLYKEESIPALKVKRGGTLILNDDDERVLKLKNETLANVVTYGLTPRADFHGKGDRIIYSDDTKGATPQGFIFPIEHSQADYEIEIKNAVGITHIYPVLAGIALAYELKVPIKKAIESFDNYNPAPGRMKIIEGIKGSTIIDDTYNASPEATKEALLTLSRVTAQGKKIAVLADMKEIGKYSIDEHRGVGAMIPNIAKKLVVIGSLGREISEGAMSAGMDEEDIYQFESSREAGKFLEKIINKGDLILVKGSQSMRMERVTEEVMLHPEWKKSLLVRQDDEWAKR
jgi:UDP-N-acetylmuramoyl-tripeptide--D-alanyl-D-alanine ligase